MLTKNYRPGQVLLHSDLHEDQAYGLRVLALYHPSTFGLVARPGFQLKLEISADSYLQLTAVAAKFQDGIMVCFKDNGAYGPVPKVALPPLPCPQPYIVLVHEGRRAWTSPASAEETNIEDVRIPILKLELSESPVNTEEHPNKLTLGLLKQDDSLKSLVVAKTYFPMVAEMGGSESTKLLLRSSASALEQLYHRTIFLLRELDYSATSGGANFGLVRLARDLKPLLRDALFTVRHWDSRTSPQEVLSLWSSIARCFHENMEPALLAQGPEDVLDVLEAAAKDKRAGENWTRDEFSYAVKSLAEVMFTPQDPNVSFAILNDFLAKVYWAFSTMVEEGTYEQPKGGQNEITTPL